MKWLLIALLLIYTVYGAAHRRARVVAPRWTGVQNRIHPDPRRGPYGYSPHGH